MENGELSQEWMDSRFRGNDGVGVCYDGVGRPCRQTEDGMVGMGGKRTSSRAWGVSQPTRIYLLKEGVS